MATLGSNIEKVDASVLCAVQSLAEVRSGLLEHPEDDQVALLSGNHRWSHAVLLLSVDRYPPALASVEQVPRSAGVALLGSKVENGRPLARRLERTAAVA